MSNFVIVLTTSSQRDIKRLGKQTALRLQKKFNYFIDSGKPLHFAEPLTKPADSQYRWRVGNYRVLFDIQGNVITILKIQHRKEVYRK